MKLSILIPVYNGASVIGEQLDALAAQEWDRPWEVVVADNGSTDGSRAVVEAYGARIPSLRVIDSPVPRSQGVATNEAARHARGDSLVCLDADDVVAPGWLAAIGAALDRHEFVASRHDATALNPEWVMRGRGRAQHDGLQTLWYPPYSPHAGSCGLGFHRRWFEAVGGLREELPCLLDTDFCIRMHKAGAKLVFVPDAVVHIRYRESSRATFFQARTWAWYNTHVYWLNRTPDARIPRGWRRYAASWPPILRLLPKARHRTGRYRLAWQLGWQIGLLQGALRHRVPPPVYQAMPQGSVASTEGAIHVAR